MQKKIETNSNINQTQETTFNEAVLEIKRVSKKTKGGNSLGFTALVAVGDGIGTVGVGLGKAKDVRSAIEKGSRKAKSGLVNLPLRGTTLPYGININRGAVHLIVKPAPVGSGIMAGGVLRQFFELAGVRDVSVKNVGTRNRFSVVMKTLDALQNMELPKEVV